MNHVEILSEVFSENFPLEWYEIATESHFWFEWRLRVFLKQIRDMGMLNKDTLKVLEIGCGHGILRKQLEDSTNWHIDGCDLNKYALIKNDVKRGRTLLYNIHDRLLFLNKAYDAVILFDILEHIKDTSYFLNSTLYHLKDGGWIFINVPALQGMISQFDKAMGHLRRYDIYTIQRELAPHGLEIKDMRYWGLSMLPLLFMRKMNIKNSNTKDIIRKGITPPSVFINNFLRKIMQIETSLIKKPVIGTSLMVAAVKLRE